MRRVLFWLSSGAITYTYLLFPLLVMVRGRLAARPYHTSEITPPVSLIIAARDEASIIRSKMNNLLALDYPSDRLEVIVASDGSTDGTDEIIRDLQDPRVRVLSFPRLGKADAINAAVAQASGEILVFSDANSLYDADALRALVRPFADPSVGGVAGDQRYTSAHAGGTSDGERRYWNLDRALKRAESRAGSAVSATGAIYAVRRSLVGLVVRGVTDDFYVSTGVIVSGHRLVFAEDAVAYEPVAASGRGEFVRKVRVITRGLRGVLLRRELLNPRRHGFYAIQLLSHKILRRLVAVPLLVLAIVSPLLWGERAIYRFATVSQFALYGAGAIGLVLGPRARLGRHAPFGVAAYFCLVNAASLVALVNLLTGRRIEQWQPDRAPGSVTSTEPRIRA